LLRLARRVLAALLGAAAGALILEVGLRVAGIAYPSFYTTDPCCGLTLRPGASGWQEEEGRAFLSVNADGLRDEDHAKARDPAHYRIAVMGDSYTLARQVALEDTYFRVAARALATCPHVPGGRAVETISFGMAGYGTAQALRLYEARARDYAPDLVVLGFLSGNDVSDNHRALTPNRMRPFYVLRDGALVLDDRFLEGRAYARRQSLAWKTLVTLSEASRTVQVLNELRNRVKDWARDRAARRGRREIGDDGELGLSNAVYRDPPPPPWDDAWRVTEALLTRFRDTVRADGADFFVLSLSNGIQVDPDPSVRAAYARAMGVPDLGHPERRLGAHLRAIDVPHRLLAPALAREAERTGQCLHGFENAEPCRGHWNEAGHAAAGRLLAERLCEGFARGELGGGSPGS
jgi:hypothetical protein